MVVGEIAVLGTAAPIVRVADEPEVADAFVGALGIDADLFAPSIIVKALIDVHTVAPVGIQDEPGSASTNVSSGGVVAKVVAATSSLLAFVGVFARLPVDLEGISFAARADRTVWTVLTSLVTTSIIDAAAVDYFHFYSVAHFAVFAGLISPLTGAGVRALRVDADVGASAVSFLTLVDVEATPPVPVQSITWITPASRFPPMVDAFVLTSSIIPSA